MTTVHPETFDLVFYDASEIGRVLDEVAAKIPGLPDDLDVTVEVDEDKPNTRVGVRSIDPVELHVESGALENLKAPRSFGEAAAAATFARLLLEVRDRLDPAFGAPPTDEELSQADAISWAVYCYGRATRLGFRIFKPKYRYDFRNRHGFTDSADADYERLWSAEDLTWIEVTGG